MEQNPPSSPSPSSKSPVWNYQGYELRPSEFTTAMVHFYRAEIQRSNTWRTRLDATTNWAVLATSAAITFSMGNPENHYGVILLNMVLVTVFLWIEARRYRYFELWSYRARLLETDFFAAMLVPPFSPHAEWAESLANSLLQPEFPISILEAFGRRLRRNYLWIYGVLLAALGMKIYLHPTPENNWGDILVRMNIGPISGDWVIALVGLFYTTLLIIAVVSSRLTESSGEVIPKFPVANSKHPQDQTTNTAESSPRRHPLVSLFHRRQQVMVWIITDHAAEIASEVMKRMKRGITALKGTGMFTNRERDILMTAVTVTEVAALKKIVQDLDSQAFVVINPVQDVFGHGFRSL